MISSPRDLGLGDLGYPSGANDPLAFSRDGRLLAASRLDGDVLVLDPSTDHIRHALTLHDPVTSLAFAPDGTLAIGTGAGTVELWNASTGQRVGAPVTVSSAPVTSVAFDGTGQRFATSGKGDGAVKLWFAATLQQEGSALETERGASSTVAFEQHTDALLAIDDQGNGFTWPMSLRAWEQRACAIAGRNFTRQEWTQLLTGQPYATACP
jgi:WD40 repeat protein